MGLHDLLLSGADAAAGFSVQRYRRLFNSSQWWSSREIEEYQNERLRTVIRNAYENIPFYREMMEERKLTPSDIRGQEDLEKLPILSKDDLRATSRERLVSKAVRTKDLVCCTSSGSTGSPFQHFVNKDAYSANKACLLRAWEWMGYSLGDSYAKISRRTHRSVYKRLQDLFNRSLYLAPADLSRANLNLLWEKLRRFSPDFVRGYPDLMVFLTEHVAREELGNLGELVAISTTGSTLDAAKRRKIEEGFGAPVFDSYSSEGGAIVAECEGRSSYHSAGEYAISEFLDAGGAAPSGAKRLIVTDLHNLAMPFIRYDTADLVTPGESGCSCGRELIPIQRIVGREGDVLFTRDGRPLLVHDFSTFFSHEDVAAFQIHQKKIDAFVVKIVAPGISHEKIKRIRRDFLDKFGAESHVEVEVVGELSPTGAGKRRLLVRDPDVRPLALHNR